MIGDEFRSERMYEIREVLDESDGRIAMVSLPQRTGDGVLYVFELRHIVANMNGVTIDATRATKQPVFVSVFVEETATCKTPPLLVTAVVNGEERYWVIEPDGNMSPVLIEEDEALDIYWGKFEEWEEKQPAQEL